MDLEYIEHIKGSPYITEGRWDQFKAKAAQQMGSLGAMAGHQIQNPSEIKLRSLWEGFIRNLKTAMKDWEDQVSPMFGSDVQLDAKEYQIKSALDNLNRVLSPMDPQKIGTVISRGYHNPNVRNQRDNPDTYVKGSTYNRSTTSPSLKNLAPKSQQGADIEEGFWDAANRDVKLNKALGSNDPAQILNAYKNYVLSLFNSFMKDAMKVTTLTAQQIYQALAKIQPAKTGWQMAGNMQKVVQNLQALQNVGDTIPKASSGSVSPVLPQQKGATQADPGTKPPIIQKKPSAQQPSGQQQPKPLAPAQDQIQGAGSEQILPQEIPFIILKAIKIINDAVSSDVSHVGKYFTVPELPTDFNQVKLTKEIDSPPKPKHGKDPGEEEPRPEEKEVPGEFVYNFHSKFRKYPGTNFSIQVKPIHEKPEVDGLPGVSIEVWWNCEDTLNKIFVIADKNGKKSKPLLIMKFFDQQTNSKAGATTPGHTNFFSTEKIVKRSDPSGADKFASSGLDQTKMAQIMSAVKQEEGKFLRSLMVVTTRKAKEFKAKTKGVFPVSISDNGNIKFTAKDGSETMVLKKDIPAHLNGPDGTKWYETLNHYDYFEEFPEMKPKAAEDYDSFKNAVVKMMQQGHGEKDSEKLIANAWLEIRPYVGDNPETITADALYAISRGDMTPEAAVSPVLGDAMLALNSLDIKGDTAKEHLVHAWSELKKTVPVENITKEMLVKSVLKKKPENKPQPAAPIPAPKTEPSTSPVSAPAGGELPKPEPQPPVSGAAGGEAPTTNPTAPVSKGQKPLKPEEEPTKKKVWLDDTGQLMFQNKKGAEGAMSAAQAAALSKKFPAFSQALKDSGIDLQAVAAAEKSAKEDEKKKKLKEINEQAVNPFQLANFL